MAYYLNRVLYVFAPTRELLLPSRVKTDGRTVVVLNAAF